ncbi:MAG: RNA pseudouridine synthase, partial [Alphaproteobacteria bacterium]|nr:RNA pseudouridine synthase [Alphaproteobacteria bacterium]
MPSHPPFDLTNRVLYRDGLVLVIDKPAGFAVHPGPGKYENLQASYAQLRFGLPRDPALAHRLDRETSGCLVLGRHAKALRKLGTLFKNNKIEKTYWAVVCGAPPNSQGTLSAPLIQQKVGGSFGYKMMVDDDGQEAITHYVVKQSDKNFSWVELKPITGRTHQLHQSQFWL